MGATTPLVFGASKAYYRTGPYCVQLAWVGGIPSQISYIARVKSSRPPTTGELSLAIPKENTSVLLGGFSAPSCDMMDPL